MQSNGGTATFDKAVRKRAAATLLSGPAGGVTAGARLSQLCGLDKVITFDMGGTSCDVALIEGGQPDLGSGGLIAGRQVALPSLDIDTVSAGGGTLASVDAQGVLVGRAGQRRVGAGSGVVRAWRRTAHRDRREPRCSATSVASHASAARSRSTGRGRQALREHVADPLGLDPIDAAKGIVDVVNIQMQEAIKGISTMRGYDLRDFVLIGFGGAGPVHAAALADDLHMAGVLIPGASGRACPRSAC